MEKCMDDKLVADKVEYIIACVAEFAQRFKLSNRQSYVYLRRFKGIDFLDKFYDMEHTFSIEDAVNDIMRICHRNGGALIL